MGTKRLTDKAIERMASVSERTEVWDAVVPSLGLRVGARRKTWQVFYYFGGAKRRDKLGTWPAMKVAEARGAAAGRLDLASQG